MPPAPTSFLARRSVGFLAGGLAMAAALAWFIRRQRSRKTLKRLEASDTTDRNEIHLHKTGKEHSCNLDRTQCCMGETNQQNELHKVQVEAEEAICDSGGGGDGHVSDKISPDDVSKSATAVVTESEAYEINSSTETSPLTSEHSGDVDDLVNENCSIALVPEAGDQRKVCEQSPALLKLDSEEAPFSWSDEVEMSVLSKLSSSPGDSNANNVTIPGESAAVQPQNGNASYKRAESPTTRSEGSQDSGRATGGLASSMSPADEAGQDGEIRHMYEFEIPNSLVGLIIGIKGKTIKELCTRTNVKMIIRPHHTASKMDTHQICTVEGPRDNINRCLQMLRRRFPANRFPELNLEPVLPPPIPSPAAELFGTQPTQLTLPEGIRCQVTVSSMVDAGHFFVQQITHPSFASLQRLDYYMLAIYSQTTGIPDLPRPCETGLLCVAPASGGWYRAVTVIYYEDQDEVLVRFVDYGGYSRIPRADLRQIRTDFMTLPFQAIECYIAHVQPVDGSSTWSDAAMQTFQALVMGRLVEAFVVGYNVDDLTPVVELFTTDENNMAIRVDRVLLEAGLARAADPSKVKRVLPKPTLSPANGVVNEFTDDEIASAHS
uniref:Tudor domain-containing protein n=1 Tax=Parascaris univalens TaxID=6257 RepID=A0A915AVT1_PARUN